MRRPRCKAPQKCPLNRSDLLIRAKNSQPSERFVLFQKPLAHKWLALKIATRRESGVGILVAQKDWQQQVCQPGTSAQARPQLGQQGAHHPAGTQQVGVAPASHINKPASALPLLGLGQQRPVALLHLVQLNGPQPACHQQVLVSPKGDGQKVVVRNVSQESKVWVNEQPTDKQFGRPDVDWSDSKSQILPLTIKVSATVRHKNHS